MIIKKLCLDCGVEFEIMPNALATKRCMPCRLKRYGIRKIDRAKTCCIRDKERRRQWRSLSDEEQFEEMMKITKQELRT